MVAEKIPIPNFSNWEVIESQEVFEIESEYHLWDEFPS
jgi:hypothetical protein